MNDTTQIARTVSALMVEADRPDGTPIDATIIDDLIGQLIDSIIE